MICSSSNLLLYCYLSTDGEVTVSKSSSTLTLGVTESAIESAKSAPVVDIDHTDNSDATGSGFGNKLWKRLKNKAPIKVPDQASKDTNRFRFLN